MSNKPVFDYATKMNDAVTSLRQFGHSVPALMLVYTAIDQMAWLSVPKERATGADFKRWVEKYMHGNNPLPVSADELWAARNGLLHTGTAESSDNLRDTAVRKVYYTVGNVVNTVNNDQSVVFINVGELSHHFITGVMWFMSDLEADAELSRNALSKLKRMLVERGLEEV
ncbi:hypothetical protein [Pseudomonas rhizosphaerae]|uniref:hypothetical protein n=1 Tax=Pseudomonas rhizosphaerae TaxID=216142 RepID=UPI002B4A32BD|nr:hypothetical protein [Pseudomonas rhizosphaerae]MEB2870254.1 hypothetical protein [Pseudomonas rhizosphaerae]